MKPPSTSADRSGLQDQVDQAVLELISRQASRVPYPVFATLVLVGFVCHGAMGTAVVVCWLLVVVAILFARHRLLGAMPDTTRALSTQVATATALSLINGLCHAFPLLYFPELETIERSMLTLTLLGLSAGSIGTTAGYRSIFLAYLCPTLLPLIVLWGFNPGGAPGLSEGIFAVLLVAFGTVLLGLANEAYDQLRQRVQTDQKLSEALVASEKAGQAKTRIFAAAGHDLRQPIQALNLYLDSLLESPENFQHVAQQMKRAIVSINQQLDSTEDFSKIDAGAVNIRTSSVELRPLLEELLSQFEAPARDKDIGLSIQCPKNLWVESDVTLLRRILQNLLGNGIKYTDAGGVSVTAEDQGAHVRLSVSDTGRGISEEDQEYVFEEYFQVGNPSRNPARGLGLGLSIVRRYTDLLNIGLHLQSEERVGTTVALLIAKSAASRPSRPEATPISPPENLGRVLIVEDDPHVAEGLAMLLQHSGNTITVAHSTEAAMDHCEDHEPDLLICDLRMERLTSGIELATDLRRRWSSLPVLLITADTGSTREVEQWANASVLRKPIEAEDLYQEIANLTHRV